MNFPKVFIIILNYNGKDFIKKTLASVFRINYPNFEVVFVDNNSVDGSFELIKREFSKITLIKNSENLGFSAGNNIGIEYALERGADYILLLNYDTEVENNFLVSLVEMMEEDKKIGIASPLIFESDGLRIWFSGGKINWLKMKSIQERNTLRENYFGSDYISGCAMLIRAEVFRRIGLFDEKYFLYWEDADFSFRAKKEGYRLAVCLKSRILHLEKSQEKKENKIYWLVLSGLIFFRKNSSLFLRPWIFFYTFLRKLKNKKDLKREKNAIAKAVQKAYHDFKYAK
ncbi:MAG TPA: glycosyltransferase family 2 protein [Candidatus Moranbacteria bacterium]|nr:glycosyltransferase family 2 protein [Candidatus Moranbacteria bacterium]